MTTPQTRYQIAKLRREGMTFEAIAKQIGVTRERARQAYLVHERKLQETNGWHPIETAPKDCTPLLLHYDSIGVVVGYYDSIGTADWWIIPKWDASAIIETPGIRGGIETVCWYQAYPYGNDGEDPTHWQPFPVPPTCAAERRNSR